MTTIDEPRHLSPAPMEPPASRPGPRLGVWLADHGPPDQRGLAARDSVTARELAQKHFGGNASSAIQVVVHSTDGPVTEGRLSHR